MREMSWDDFEKKWGRGRMFGHGLKQWWQSWWHCAFRLHQHGYIKIKGEPRKWICWTCKDHDIDQ